MKRIKVRSHSGLDPSFLHRVSQNPAGPLPPKPLRRASVGEFYGPGGMAASPESAAVGRADLATARTPTGDGVPVPPSRPSD